MTTKVIAHASNRVPLWLKFAYQQQSVFCFGICSNYINNRAIHLQHILQKFYVFCFIVYYYATDHYLKFSGIFTVMVVPAAFPFSSFLSVTFWSILYNSALRLDMFMPLL